jgi:hypothetical protein
VAPVQVAPPPAPEPAASGEDDLETLGAALAALPQPPRVQGSETLTVTVHTLAGQPVAGVEVEATPERESDTREPRRRSGDPPRSPEEQLRSYAWRLLHDRRSTVTGTTGATGTCILTGLAPVQHHLTVRAAGYELDRKRGGHRPVPPATVEYEARALVLLPVRVLLPEGGAPEEAQVRVRYGNRGTGFQWRPEDPDYELRADETATLTASTSGERELRSEPVEVREPAGSSPAPVVLQLVGRTGIRGQVHGLPEDGWYEVQALLHSGSEPPRLGRHRRVEHRDHVRAHNNGAFELLDLPPGDYYVRLVADRDTELAATRVHVSDDVVTCELQCPAPETRPRDSYAKVWVRKPDGELVDRARLSMRLRSGGGSYAGGVHTERLEDGSYLVEHLEPEADWHVQGAVERFLVVRVQGFGELEVPYQRVPATVIEVQLEEPATLQVRVAGLIGSGHESEVDVSVWKQDPGGGRSGLGRGKVIGPGTFEFEGLAPGEVLVRLELGSDHPFGEALLDQRTVQLHPGPNTATLSFPLLCRLELLADELDPGTWVRLRHLGTDERDPRARSGRIDDAHRAVIERLPAGEYRLRAGDRQMRVVLRGDATVVWQPEAQDALRVYVSQPQGYLGNAGFESGDLIVGVDGEVDATAAELQARLIEIAAERGQATVMVNREGATLTITVDALRFTTKDSLGGGWSRASSGGR